jgi:hypothetical protein
MTEAGEVLKYGQRTACDFKLKMQNYAATILQFGSQRDITYWSRDSHYVCGETVQILNSSNVKVCPSVRFPTPVFLNHIWAGDSETWRKNC